MSEAVATVVAPVAPQAELPLSQPAPRRFEIPADPAPAEAGKPDQNIAEQAPAAKPDAKPDATPEEVTPEQAAKRDGRRFERKLDKAYRQRAEAQARAEILEKRLAELEKNAAPKPPQEGEPRLEQFDFDPEKYAAAKAEFAKTQATKEYEAKQKTESQKQAHQKLVSGWEEKAERGADKYDDWQEKVGEIQPNTPWSAALMEAENGDDIAHYLGSNPKEAMRIAQLPPLSQVREIGKLEAKFLSEPVKPKAPSKAPAPIAPLQGTGNSASTEPTEEDSMKEWIVKRNRQVHGRRR